MTKKKGYPKPEDIKSDKTLRHAYKRMYEQAGGLPRAVSIIKASDKEFMLHLDRMARLEPKESSNEHNINILLSVPEVKKQLENNEVIDLELESYTLDDTPTTTNTKDIEDIEDIEEPEDIDQ